MCRTQDEVFHGPYVDYHPNGSIASRGQYDHGFRSGRWTFFDAAGVKTGETEFAKGDYHGTRIEFFADGHKKSETLWRVGKREGMAKVWDARGNLTSTLYRADRPVVASAK
ncbi:MAG TPA: hypothetical protein VEY30_10650 [Myxococcaceae bacterium]|nr:hypothetical protein [Myxococcaceae bacterium]